MIPHASKANQPQKNSRQTAQTSRGSCFLPSTEPKESSKRSPIHRQSNVMKGDKIDTASLLLMAAARVKVPSSWGQAFGSTTPSGGGGVGAAADGKDLFFFLPSSTATASSCWWPWLPCPQLFPSRLGVAQGMGCCVEAGARARVWDEKGKAAWTRQARLR